MTDYNEDWCPSSKSNKHYFQPIETKSNFEVFLTDGVVSADFELPTLYERVEYTYLYCNCGAIKKVRI